MINFTKRRLTIEAYSRKSTYNTCRLPVEQASTLIPDAYTATEFFSLEQEKVLANSWIAVCCIQQVSEPGNIFVAEVAGRSILVLFDKKGKLRAFYNFCRHRGSKLLEENCQRKSISCPYHGWVYGLDGQCLGTTMFKKEKSVGSKNDLLNSDQFDKKDYGLFPVNVQSWGFLVFVNLSQEPTPLGEWLGDLPQKFKSHGLNDWTIVSRKNYDVFANYKLISENFMEYYHLPFVHPELSEISRVEDHHRFQGTGMYTGMLTTPVSKDVNSVWLNLPAVEGLTVEQQTCAYHICIFPNLTFTLLPNHVFCTINDPVRADQTRERTFLLTHPGNLDNEKYSKMFEELAIFWDKVNTQDLDIVERVQAGLSNAAYSGGTLCYQFEEPLHRYQNWVADRMCDIHRVPLGD